MTFDICGNSADPGTLATQISKIRKRFNIHNVALVGDRGMITSARIREDLLPVALDWISALRNAEIRKLFKDQKDSETDTKLCASELQPDQVAEIVSAEFPGERLLVCLNPRLRQQRAQKREQLLRATETILTEIAAAARRHKSNSANRDRTIKRLGREANRRKVEKHFDITVTDSDLLWSRNQQRIDNEAKLDGIYVIRTSLSADAINAHDAVAAYKSLSTVERAFRTIKTTRLEVQPIYVYSELHVRAHVFLCMLACYLEWHLRQRLKPFLFDDQQPPSRSSPVQQANPAAEQNPRRTQCRPQCRCFHKNGRLIFRKSAYLLRLRLILVVKIGLILHPSQINLQNVYKNQMPQLRFTFRSRLDQTGKRSAECTVRLNYPKERKTIHSALSPHWRTLKLTVGLQMIDNFAH